MKIINVYETSKESENRLKKLSGNKWQAKINDNLSCTISIDPKRSFQTLKGFGCASTEAAGYVLSFLDKAEQKKVVKVLSDLGIAGCPDIVLIDARNNNKPSASIA